MRLTTSIGEMLCGIAFLLHVVLIEHLLSENWSVVYISITIFVASIFWWFVFRNDREFTSGVLISGGVIVYALCDYLHSIGAQLPTKRAGEFLPQSVTMAVGLAALSFSMAGILKITHQYFYRKVKI